MSWSEGRELRRDANPVGSSRAWEGFWYPARMHWPSKIRSTLAATVESLEGRWFDRTRNVHTLGYVSLQSAGVSVEETRDSELYCPARPANIRRALLETGIQNVSNYTFVDFGSGKGRALFVAAELPFEEVIGAELSSVLHEQALANIHRFRRWGRGCTRVASVQVNARDFLFPDKKLVLYFFNPFGVDTMQYVLNNLQSSLERDPRHVVIVLLWPRCGDLVAGMKGMRLLRDTRRHQIFEFQEPSGVPSIA